MTTFAALKAYWPHQAPDRRKELRSAINNPDTFLELYKSCKDASERKKLAEWVAEVREEVNGKEEGNLSIAQNYKSIFKKLESDPNAQEVQAWKFQLLKAESSHLLLRDMMLDSQEFLAIYKSCGNADERNQLINWIVAIREEAFKYSKQEKDKPFLKRVSVTNSKRLSLTPEVSDALNSQYKFEGTTSATGLKTKHYVDIFDTLLKDKTINTQELATWIFSLLNQHPGLQEQFRRKDGMSSANKYYAIFDQLIERDPSGEHRVAWQILEFLEQHADVQLIVANDIADPTPLTSKMPAALLYNNDFLYKLDRFSSLRKTLESKLKDKATPAFVQQSEGTVGPFTYNNLNTAYYDLNPGKRTGIVNGLILGAPVADTDPVRYDGNPEKFWHVFDNCKTKQEREKLLGWISLAANKIDFYKFLVASELEGNDARYSTRRWGMLFFIEQNIGLLAQYVKDTWTEKTLYYTRIAPSNKGFDKELETQFKKGLIDKANGTLGWLFHQGITGFAAGHFPETFREFFFHIMAATSISKENMELIDAKAKPVNASSNTTQAEQQVLVAESKGSLLLLDEPEISAQSSSSSTMVVKEMEPEPVVDESELAKIEAFFKVFVQNPKSVARILDDRRGPRAKDKGYFNHAVFASLDEKYLRLDTVQAQVLCNLRTLLFYDKPHELVAQMLLDNPAVTRELLTAEIYKAKHPQNNRVPRYTANYPALFGKLIKLMKPEQLLPFINQYIQYAHKKMPEYFLKLVKMKTMTEQQLVAFVSKYALQVSPEVLAKVAVYVGKNTGEGKKYSPAVAEAFWNTQVHYVDMSLAGFGNKLNPIVGVYVSNYVQQLMQAEKINLDALQPFLVNEFLFNRLQLIAKPELFASLVDKVLRGSEPAAGFIIKAWAVNDAAVNFVLRHKNNAADRMALAGQSLLWYVRVLDSLDPSSDDQRLERDSISTRNEDYMVREFERFINDYSSQELEILANSSSTPRVIYPLVAARCVSISDTWLEKLTANDPLVIYNAGFVREINKNSAVAQRLVSLNNVHWEVASAGRSPVQVLMTAKATDTASVEGRMVGEFSHNAHLQNMLLDESWLRSPKVHMLQVLTLIHNLRDIVFAAGERSGHLVVLSIIDSYAVILSSNAENLKLFFKMMFDSQYPYYHKSLDAVVPALAQFGIIPLEALALVYETIFEAAGVTPETPEHSIILSLKAAIAQKHDTKLSLWLSDKFADLFPAPKTPALPDVEQKAEDEDFEEERAKELSRRLSRLPRTMTNDAVDTSSSIPPSDPAPLPPTSTAQAMGKLLGSASSEPAPQQEQVFPKPAVPSLFAQPQDTSGAATAAPRATNSLRQRLTIPALNTSPAPADGGGSAKQQPTTRRRFDDTPAAAPAPGL